MISHVMSPREREDEVDVSSQPSRSDPPLADPEHDAAL